MPSSVPIVAAVLIAAAVFGLYRKRTDGRLRRYDRAADGREPESLGSAELGTALGSRATLLQFSSETCQPCRATARILAEVSSQVDGVSHVELDAEANLELVRRLGVLRTPTVFVLDGRGVITLRSTGLVRRQEVLAALGVSA